MKRIILLTFLCLLVISLDNVCQVEIVRADNHFFIKEGSTSSNACFIIVKLTPAQENSNLLINKQLNETYKIIEQICIKQGYKETEKKYYNDLMEVEREKDYCIELVFTLKVEQRVKNRLDRFDYNNTTHEMCDTPIIYSWWNIFRDKKYKMGNVEYHILSMEQRLKWTDDLNKYNEEMIKKRANDLMDEIGGGK